MKTTTDENGETLLVITGTICISVAAVLTTQAPTMPTIAQPYIYTAAAVLTTIGTSILAFWKKKVNIPEAKVAQS